MYYSASPFAAAVSKIAIMSHWSISALGTQVSSTIDMTHQHLRGKQALRIHLHSVMDLVPQARSRLANWAATQVLYHTAQSP